MAKKDTVEAELEKVAEAKAEYARRDYTQTSDSGRTTVSVEMLESGKGTVTIDRDGQRVHRIDFEKEPAQKAGLGT